MTVAQLDIIAGWAALVLTLMVFSYLIRDNFLYRIAVHILIGAAAAYAAIAAMADVIVPWLNATVLAEEGDAEAAVRALGLLPVVLALLLILKLLPRYAYIGNFTMLIVIGVGAGVALVGAVIGTIIPLIRQIGDIAETEETLNTVVVVTGTVTTLAYFHYTSHRRRPGDPPTQILPIRLLRVIGQGFIAVTLGALYAQAILTSLAIFNRLLDEHMRFLLDQVGG